VPEITTLFCDIGGVILTNGWDHVARMEAAQMFGLDWVEFRERHDLSFPAFDAGQITLTNISTARSFIELGPSRGKSSRLS